MEKWSNWQNAYQIESRIDQGRPELYGHQEPGIWRTLGYCKWIKLGPQARNQCRYLTSVCRVAKHGAHATGHCGCLSGRRTRSCRFRWGGRHAVAIPTASLRTMRRGAMHYGFIEWPASGSCQVVRRSPVWTIETSFLSEARHRSSGCSVGMRTQQHVTEFRGRQAGAAVRGTWERIFSIPRSSFVARFLLTLTL